VLRAELFNQFGNATQRVLLVVGLKGFAETVSKVLGFNLEQNLMEQSKLARIHALDFVVQHGLQFFGRD
jgi:hypothetical protein